MFELIIFTIICALAFLTLCILGLIIFALLVCAAVTLCTPNEGEEC